MIQPLVPPAILVQSTKGCRRLTLLIALCLCLLHCQSPSVSAQEQTIAAPDPGAPPAPDRTPRGSIAVPTASTSQETATSSTEHELAALFTSKCLACHRRDKREGGYAVDSFVAVRKPGDSGIAPIIAKQPNKSELLRRLTTSDADERMPAEAPSLSPQEIELVRRWIDAGAPVDPAIERQSMATLVRRSRLEIPRHYPRTIPITALALASNQHTAWVSGYGEVLCWRWGSALLLGRLAVAGPQVADIELSLDEKYLAVSSGVPGEQGFIELWALSTEDPDAALHGRKLPPPQLVWTRVLGDIAEEIAFSPDASQLAIGCSDGSLIVSRCQLEPGQSELSSQLYTPHADAILAVNWSADGKRLITGSRDRTAKIYDAEKVELIANYDRHERAVGGVAYLRDNPVSFDETGKLRLWPGDDSDKTLAEKDNLARFLEPVISSNDRLWLADGSRVRQFYIERKTVEDGQDADGKPKTKKVTKWLELKPLVEPALGWILSTAVSSDWVAAGDDQGRVTIWTRTSGAMIDSFRANP